MLVVIEVKHSYFEGPRDFEELYILHIVLLLFCNFHFLYFYVIFRQSHVYLIKWSLILDGCVILFNNLTSVTTQHLQQGMTLKILCSFNLPK